MEHCVDETPDDGTTFGGKEDEKHVHRCDESREVACGYHAQQRLEHFRERRRVVGEEGRFAETEVRIENRHHRLEVFHVARVFTHEDGKHGVYRRGIGERWQSHRPTPKNQAIFQKQILLRVG